MAAPLTSPAGTVDFLRNPAAWPSVAPGGSAKAARAAVAFLDKPHACTNPGACYAPGSCIRCDPPDSDDSMYETCLEDLEDDSQRDYSIDVSSCGLTSLPEELKLLVRLRIFDCGFNNLRELPAGLGGCADLRILICHENLLKTLPESLAECTDLRELHCGENELTKLPSALGRCARLLELRCRGNKLEHLPESIGDCVELHTLICRVNRLESLPETLGNCTRLRDFDCTANYLKTLPSSIARCAELRLRCGENPLEAPLGDLLVAGWYADQPAVLEALRASGRRTKAARP